MTTRTIYNPLPAGQTDMAAPTDYIDKDFIKVYKRNHTTGLTQETFVGTLLTSGSDYTWLNDGTIRLTSAADGQTDYLIARQTQTLPLVTQQPGVFSSDKVNLAIRQALHLAEEAREVTEGVSDLALRQDLASVAAGKGSSLVGYSLGNTQAVSRTVLDRLRDRATGADYGIVGTGTEDVAIAKAEASPSPYIDLCGKTVTTSLAASSLTKEYYNGTLKANNGTAGVSCKVLTKAPLYDYEIIRRRTKSPLLSWTGKNVLWLGTSIPAYGFTDGNSYPDLFGQMLGCTVTVKAWPGSHVFYKGTAGYASLTTNADRQNYIQALSMTEDDRLAGVAAYGTGSAYYPGFDAITSPVEMTCDNRIKSVMSGVQQDVVVLDHAINDNSQPEGSDAYETISIISVTKGATTQITLGSIGTLVVGDAIFMRVNGIAKLDHHACRIQAVAGNTITVSLNSSGFTGTFTSGTVSKVDRNTLWGGFEFILHYIYWAAAYYDRAVPIIIMASVPSNYHYNAFSDNFSSVSRTLLDISEKWGLSLFDINYLYGITLKDNPIFFPDGVHASTPATRQALANYWAEWAQGGAVKTVNESKLLTSTGAAYSDQREPVYDELLGGFATPSHVRGDYVSVLTDNFSDGDYAGWTLIGSNVTVVAAPWNASEKAIRCISTAGSASELIRAAALDAVSELSMSVYLPAVSGLISSGLAVVTLAKLTNGTGGPTYTVELVITPTTTSIRMGYFTAPNGTGLNYAVGAEYLLSANTKYTVSLKGLKASTGNYKGALVLKINGTIIARATNVSDETQTTGANVEVGISYSTVTGSITAYISDVAVGKRAVNAYAARFTGTKTVNSQTWTFVNGILVSIV